MAVTHTPTTAEPNDADYDVSATAWNNSHVVGDGSFVAAKLSATATDKVFGRSTAGAGNGEEIALTAAGRALIDDANAAAQLVTLGVAAAITGTKLDDLTAPDDNTDLNATTGAHGLLPKLGGGTTNFLRADGSWNAPAGGGAEFPTGNAKIATSETTASTSFADLATPGPSVTVTVGASGKVKLTVSARVASTGAFQNFIGVVLSGANTVAAATIFVAGGTITEEYSRTTILTGLTPGSTTFKMQYAVSAGTGTFQVRELIVEPVL